MKWEQVWLNYHPLEHSVNQNYFRQIYCPSEAVSAVHAAAELIRAAKGFYQLEAVVTDRLPAQDGIVLLLTGDGDYEYEEELKSEGYRIAEKDRVLYLTANTPAGLLYGAFALIRMAAGRTAAFAGLTAVSVPDKELRMLNHWDNMDGSIERGYSGQSFFFEHGEIIMNERTRDYARLLASTGINATVINNVNVKGEATELITERYLPRLAELARLLAEYGIRLFLSLNYAACIELGGTADADPHSPEVIAWWERQMELVYRYIPTLGGFLVKADSEGRPGPFTYGCNQADGANLLAQAILPYGGMIIWRCFVYNCRQDWRDRQTDRARAAYDYFYNLDGCFMDNVILQIKNGPLDFQVREPFMPLFGKLQKTRHMMEVQIAQEYTGQQIDICYLIPWFKELLDSRTGCGGTEDRIADILGGSACNGMGMGIAAVANTGDDSNWTGHDLAAANLYGYGRIAWDSGLSPAVIAAEWAALTFSPDPEGIQTICRILMDSWPVYESYTAPLGIGFMVKPNHHYGPDVDGYEYSRWGTYHRADHLGLGVDRGISGTGYAALYHPELAARYADPMTCPDNLLLFFHHVPYSYVLQNGKTVIQHIYDSHFQGVADVEAMIVLWRSLKDRIDERRFIRVSERMQLQLANAVEWRDQINSYFYRKAGIPDEKQRTIY